LSKEKQKDKLIFSDDDVLNYYLSLKTKPFVILMGLSGSGKTKLAMRFADAMTGGDKSRYTMVPVEAGWVDSKNLLGYYNPLSNSYNSTDFLKVLIRAYNNYIKSILINKKEEIHPYFIILDEMNLSKVEYYFSKFLSVLETKKSIPIRKLVDELDYEIYDSKLDETMMLTEPITLHNDPKLEDLLVETPKDISEIKTGMKIRDKDEYIWDITAEDIDLMKEFEAIPREKKENALWNGEITGTFIKWVFINKGDYYQIHVKDAVHTIPRQIRVPPNLYFTGTVNVDETTYMFSPKVLDRANSIELTNINIDDFEEMLFQETPELPPDSAKMELKEMIADFTYNYKFKFELNDLKENSTSIKKDLRLFEKLLREYFRIIKDLSKEFKMAPKFKFGYRVINEMFKYIVNSLDLLGVSDEIFKKFALDLQLKQKILPKIHGMKSEIEKLLEALKSPNYEDFEVFQEKVGEMLDELKLKQFTSYM